MMYEPGSMPVSEIIDLLASTPEDVTRALQGLAGPEFQQRSAGSELSIFDICQGMRTEAEHGHKHFQRATGEVEDEGSAVGDQTLEAELTALKLVRAQSVALLAKLDPSAWSHSAIDPEWGNLTIEHAALRLIASEEEALDRIAAARKAIGK